MKNRQFTYKSRQLITVEELGKYGSRTLYANLILYGFKGRPFTEGRIIAGWTERWEILETDIIVRTREGVFRVLHHGKRDSLKSFVAGLPEGTRMVHEDTFVNLKRKFWYDVQTTTKEPWVAFEVVPTRAGDLSREQVGLSRSGRATVRDHLGLTRKRTKLTRDKAEAS